MKTIYIDYHVHTAYSDDSIYLMEDCIKDAIEKGIKDIAITDHVDYGIKVDWDEGKDIVYRNNEPMTNVNYPKWEKEFLIVKEKYKDQISMKMGMELKLIHHIINMV